MEKEYTIKGKANYYKTCPECGNDMEWVEGDKSPSGQGYWECACGKKEKQGFNIHTKTA
jgi:hypothetical protein